MNRSKTLSEILDVCTKLFRLIFSNPSRATLQQGRPLALDPTKQPAFWFDSDLAFGYLQSDKFMSARPPDDGQLPRQRGRPPDDEHSPKHRGRPSDDERSPEQRGRTPRIPEGQPSGAATKTAQTQDTDGRGGKKESMPRARSRVGTFAGTLYNPAR